MKEARYWDVVEGTVVKCRLCPHGCVLKDGQTGICGVRENRGGVLYSLVYGLAISASVDPIEKKPLYHLLPGSKAFSIATVGCNLKCQFCQNADISQYPHDTGGVTGREMPPEVVVEEAIKARCAVMSYTYTEPTIYLEYALDCARLARERGLLNTLVTNGFTSPDIVRDEFPGLIDGANVDLKAFTEDFYHRLCKARLQPVLEAIEAYVRAGVWLEVTTLVIPGENDSDGELRDIARFLAGLSVDIPWHLSRYWPRYKYDIAPPTPVETLERARKIGLREGLRYVYTGNVPGHAGEHTHCPFCGRRIIAREGFFVVEKHLDDNRCGFCHKTIAGRMI